MRRTGPGPWAYLLSVEPLLQRPQTEGDAERDDEQGENGGEDAVVLADVVALREGAPEADVGGEELGQDHTEDGEAGGHPYRGHDGARGRREQDPREVLPAGGQQRA